MFEVGCVNSQKLGPLSQHTKAITKYEYCGCSNSPYSDTIKSKLLKHLPSLIF